MMTIGVDISQTVYGTGVGGYLTQLVEHMISQDQKNSYVLFGSSLRQRELFKKWQEKYHKNPRVHVKIFPFPPTMLDLLWNKMHTMPIENLIGSVDIFISSDWTQPPTKRAKKATILYDLIVYKHPKETDTTIIATQKRKLSWVKKEIDMALCISEATKKDAMEILKLPERKLRVVYPGL